MYALQDFQGLLAQWWKDADSYKGNLTLSASKIAALFVKNKVFTEVETTRRAFLINTV